MDSAAVHESGTGTFETSTDVRYATAFGGKAEPTLMGRAYQRDESDKSDGSMKKSLRCPGVVVLDLYTVT